MSECADEQLTQHYRGRWFGFGPVRDSEYVFFAVFDDMPHSSLSIAANSFSKNLKNSTESIGRGSYVTIGDFKRHIVRNKSAIGVVRAHVSAIRMLRAEIQLNAITKRVRSVCILDRVERDDCDGHATMGYGKETAAQGMSQGQIGKKRLDICRDLAREFSNIIPIEKNRWPWTVRVLAGRIVSIIRVILATRIN